MQINHRDIVTKKQLHEIFWRNNMPKKCYIYHVMKDLKKKRYN